jgi:hypothetical protein
MESKNQEREKEIQRFLSLTTPQSARLTLMKLYFNSDKKILNEKDEEEVYLMYNLLERI